MKHIKAVVFDMDGVLVDAREWHYRALNKALMLFGYQISLEDHLAVFDGLPTREKLEILSQRKGFPPTLHSFVNELKQKYTIEMIHQFCRPTFKHQYALQQLKNENLKIGLASNSISATIDLMMEKTQLKKYLDMIISADSVTIGKPNPEIYLKIFKLLDVKPCEVVVLEDNANGIESATSAGAHVLIVKNSDEVNLGQIKKFIEEVEEANCKQ